MILNKKAKEEFEKWVFKNYPKYANNYHNNHLSIFTDLTQQMTNALIIEFFDSVGITVDVMPILNEKIKFQPNTFCLKKDIITEEIEYYETRQEATTEAIKKAVGIYNQLTKL